MILVTGATGFLGRNLILSLSEKKDNIIGQFRREKKLNETRNFFIANNKEEIFLNINNKAIYKSKLTQHTKSVHQGLLRYSCTICKFKSAQKVRGTCSI